MEGSGFPGPGAFPARKFHGAVDYYAEAHASAVQQYGCMLLESCSPENCVNDNSNHCFETLSAGPHAASSMQTMQVDPGASHGQTLKASSSSAWLHDTVAEVTNAATDAAGGSDQDLMVIKPSSAVLKLNSLRWRSKASAEAVRRIIQPRAVADCQIYQASCFRDLDRHNGHDVSTNLAPAHVMACGALFSDGFRTPVSSALGASMVDLHYQQVPRVPSKLEGYLIPIDISKLMSNKNGSEVRSEWKAGVNMLHFPA